uniref:Uncharacterized protein n=1 Tax=Ditylum brightwellii TaxID=49249 RepID=A0A6U3P8L8_9STRA
MSQTLRRSRRVKKPSTYKVGDIVKVSRNSGGSSDGRLLYRLTEGQSPSTNLWLVAFDDEHGVRDEEVYETKFGNLVQRADPDVEEGTNEAADQSSMPKAREGRQEELTQKSKHGSAADEDGTDSSTGAEQESGRTNKRKTGKKEGSKGSKQPLTAKRKGSEDKSALPLPPVISDCSSSASNSAAAQQPQGPKVSAREQRRLRRQAALDEQVPSIGCVSSQYQQVKSGVKRPMAQSQRPLSVKKAKKEKEEVITVQLNTGVLYLYRGINRRAVFVRKY